MPTKDKGRVRPSCPSAALSLPGIMITILIQLLTNVRSPLMMRCNVPTNVSLETGIHDN